MMFAGTAGFLLLIIAAVLVVQALSKPKPKGTLTTAWAHFLNEGDTIEIPRDGVCVVTRVVSATTVEYEPLRHDG